MVRPSPAPSLGADLPIAVATIEKSAIEEVRVALAEFKGVVFLDVRTFADFKADGEKAATKKGVSLRLDRLPALIGALQRAEGEARARGLIPAEARP